MLSVRGLWRSCKPDVENIIVCGKTSTGDCNYSYDQSDFFFSFMWAKFRVSFWSWNTWGLNKACIQTGLFTHHLSCLPYPRCCIFHAFWTLLYQNSSPLCFSRCRCRGTPSTAAPSSATCMARWLARTSATTACPSRATSTTTTSAPSTPASSPWWPSVPAAAPSSSFPSSRWAPQCQLAFQRMSRGWRRDRLPRELDCRGCSVSFVVQIGKLWKRPQLP